VIPAIFILQLKAILDSPPAIVFHELLGAAEAVLHFCRMRPRLFAVAQASFLRRGRLDERLPADRSHQQTRAGDGVDPSIGGELAGIGQKIIVT